MKYLVPIFLLLFLAACSEEAREARNYPDTLEGQKQLLGDKRQEMKDLQAEIKKIELRVAELDTTKQEAKKVLVTTMPVPVKDFAHYVDVQGSVAPANDPVMASSETGGRILKMPWKEGDYIKQGQLVAKIDVEAIQKNIAEVEKSLELARDVYERQSNLWEQNIGSEVQYLQAKNQVESLEKRKESLQLQLSKGNVYSPMSGTVDMVMAKQGEMAGPGTPILQILNTRALKVEAAVPENYLTSIRKGATLDISFPALDSKQSARVSFIGTKINPANRTFEIEANLSNTKDLKPNLLAIVHVRDYEEKEAIVVPDELILQDLSGRNYVMVQNGDKAAKRIVQIGRGYEGETIVKEGLKADDVLIVKGAREVKEGDLLALTESNE